MRAHRIDVDLAGMLADIGLAVEEHAIRRGANRPGCCAWHGCSGLNHGSNLGERRRRGATGVSRGPAEARDRNHAAADAPGPPRAAQTLVAQVKKWRMTGPIASTMATMSQLNRRKQERVMIADHREYDRQVRWLLWTERVLPICSSRDRLLARNERRDGLLLVGDDDDKDVGDHDGADERADLHKGAAPTGRWVKP